MYFSIVLALAGDSTTIRFLATRLLTFARSRRSSRPVGAMGPGRQTYTLLVRPVKNDAGVGILPGYPVRGPYVQVTREESALEAIVKVMEEWVIQYGYLAVFLLMLAESACIPFPSEVTMLVGGWYTADGTLSFF